MQLTECYFIFTGTRVTLVDGVNPSEGRLEIEHNNEWGTVCEHNFDESDARVICRMLGYDTVYVENLSYMASTYEY